MSDKLNIEEVNVDVNSKFCIYIYIYIYISDFKNSENILYVYRMCTFMNRSKRRGHSDLDGMAI
jgi:hypothetical protein